MISCSLVSPGSNHNAMESKPRKLWEADATRQVWHLAGRYSRRFGAKSWRVVTISLYGQQPWPFGPSC
jgi:hypothetical protein